MSADTPLVPAHPHPDDLAVVLAAHLGQAVRIRGARPLASQGQGDKGFGYGSPLLVEYALAASGQVGRVVLSVMRSDHFGHEFAWDRAAQMMFVQDTASRLPGHVPAMGLGFFDDQGRAHPLPWPAEFFSLTDYAPGRDYYLDLQRVRGEGLSGGDLAFAASLGRYLASIHVPAPDKEALYVRRARELMGGSECIDGLVDSYPASFELFGKERFVALEKALVDWRWRLKEHASRCCVVHGDFHPWNVLVREDGGFSTLDRSRGEFGEAADDVAAMAINYLVFGLAAKDGRVTLRRDFLDLFQAFFESYLEARRDPVLCELLAPFFVFRCLVVASPLWYPRQDPLVRRAIFAFAEGVLADRAFDPSAVTAYFGGITLTDEK